MRQSSRPVGIIVIAIYQIWMGVVTNLLGGCSVFFGLSNLAGGGSMLLLSGLLTSLPGLVALVCGIQLFARRRWAWRGSLIFHVVVVILSLIPLGLLIMQVAQIATNTSPTGRSGLEFMVFLTLLYLLIVGVSLWSFIYLRKPEIKALFIQ
jgi:uncharacterized membrane protein YhaH (DUF805 family)